ncbi:MAG: PAS domain S-box-containing protein [Oleispira sp.]
MNSQQSANILVVDDIEANRKLLSHHLKRAGYRVETAKGGIEALEMLSSESFDLVLLDIMMPEVDGFIVLKSLRKHYQASELAVIMISAIDSSEEIVKALHLGANDYISKPFDVNIMLSRVGIQLKSGSLYKQLQLSEERYKLAFSASNDGLWDWDIESGTVFYSDRWREMMGLANNLPLDSIEKWLDRVYPDDVDALRDVIYGHLSAPATIVHHEYRALFGDGNYRWMLCRAKALFGKDGKAVRMTSSQSDISATKIFDPITGLPNGLVFMDRLNRTLAHAERIGVPDFALISMSVDNREKITSAIGSAGYDKLSNEISQRLLGILRVDDYLSPPGKEVVLTSISDRYMLLIEDIYEHKNDALVVANRIKNILIQPFIIFEETIHCSLSMGICIPTIIGQSCDELIGNCISAETTARKEGCSIRIYDSAIDGRSIDRLRLEHELCNAIRCNELRVHYQPIVSLLDGSEVGSESLVRWQHPVRELLSPYHFIQLAEDVGLIESIDEWVFRESCRQHMMHASLEDGSLTFMSVNISVKGLNSKWVEVVRSVIEEFLIPPECVHFEITESIFLGDIEETIALLNQLVDIGLSFAIDDFGTGYSCFSYLRRLPVTYLKIDKTFVDDIINDPKAELLVQNIILMGHGLGMKIIAEGIEHKEQAEILKNMGCDFAQGYYFGRPRPRK